MNHVLAEYAAHLEVALRYFQLGDGVCAHIVEDVVAKFIKLCDVLENELFHLLISVRSHDFLALCIAGRLDDINVGVEVYVDVVVRDVGDETVDVGRALDVVGSGVDLEELKEIYRLGFVG